MPRSASTNKAKTPKASQTDISGEQRLKMQFKKHLVNAKDSLANASILMDLHKTLRQKTQYGSTKRS